MSLFDALIIEFKGSLDFILNAISDLTINIRIPKLYSIRVDIKKK